MIIELKNGDFGKAVRFYRIAKGLSVEELAERSGLFAYELEEIESGTCMRIYEETLMEISRVLHIPAKILLEKE